METFSWVASVWRFLWLQAVQVGQVQSKVDERLAANIMFSRDANSMLTVMGSPGRRVEVTRGVESGKSGLAEVVSRIFAPACILVRLI